MGINNNILTINAGSSSVKLALFSADNQLIFCSEVTSIGQSSNTQLITLMNGSREASNIQADNHTQAIRAIFDSASDTIHNISSIGHRIVHGGPYFLKPTIIEPGVIEKLESLTAFNPEHVPAEIDLLRFFCERFPDIPQVCCFDTTFYANMPDVAKRLPLPRKFAALGLRRYGFHGLSYQSILDGFEKSAGATAAQGQIIIAHLGSGASLTAVKDGKPIDTTMSFTPASGIPMSTRSGDLDPGIAMFLQRQAGLTGEQFNRMIHFESGLLGVSGLSADMKVLLYESANSQSAAQAIDLFCYQIQKTIGSFVAVLGGLDSLIFTGGIGEKSSIIRAKICQHMEHLGIIVQDQRNQDNEFLISDDTSKVGVHVMHTNEASVIATQTQQAIKEALI